MTKYLFTHEQLEAAAGPHIHLSRELLVTMIRATPEDAKDKRVLAALNHVNRFGTIVEIGQPAQEEARS